MFQQESTIRDDQTHFGRRVLSTRPGTPPRPSAPRRAPVAKGHDAQLKALQDSGDTVRVTMLSGESYEGAIVARDKFTITIKFDGQRKLSEPAQVRQVTLYKHALESFEPVIA